MYRNRKRKNIIRGIRMGEEYGSRSNINGIYGGTGRDNVVYGEYGYNKTEYEYSDGRYSQADNKNQRICRLNASETRAGQPYARHEPEYSGYGGYRKYEAYNGSRTGQRTSGAGAVTRSKRRIFSMAAWTASFIMLLNMLPVDSPVSQVISKYEESLPAMSFGLDELKNGPDGSSESGSGSDSESAAGHSGAADEEVISENIKTMVSEGTADTKENNTGSSVIENIALVTSADESSGKVRHISIGDDAAASSFNGIKLVLSDEENANAATGAAASENSTGSAASQTAQSSAGGAASAQLQNGSSPSQTPPAAPSQQTVLTTSAADSSKTAKVSSATGSGDIIIYHTHATEAYAPVATAETTHSADTAGTVREAANNLAAALKAKGYNVIHDTTLHDSPSYNKSYNRSLETLKKLLGDHASPKLVIDFHRDAATASGKAKTAKVNGETVASFALVVGTKNDNYKSIRALADKIVKKSNELYPGLCTGVIEKPYKFNGYLSNSYILLELGNNANTIAQVNAAAPYVADVLTNAVQ